MYLSIYLSMQVVSGANLPKKDSGMAGFGSCDPYCVLRFVGQDFNSI